MRDLLPGSTTVASTGPAAAGAGQSPVTVAGGASIGVCGPGTGAQVSASWACAASRRASRRALLAACRATCLASRLLAGRAVGVLGGPLGAPGQPRLALGVDGEEQAAEQAEVLEEVLALRGALGRVLLLPERVPRKGGRAPGTRRARRRRRGSRPRASSVPAPTMAAPLARTSSSGSSGRPQRLGERLDHRRRGLGPRRRVLQLVEPADDERSRRAWGGRRGAPRSSGLPLSVRTGHTVVPRTADHRVPSLSAMCGRYAATANPTSWSRSSRSTRSHRRARPAACSAPPRSPPPGEPDYNMAPTKRAPVVLTRAPRATTRGRRGRTAVRQLRLLTWGLVPSWSKDIKVGLRMINARAESVAGQAGVRQGRGVAGAAWCRPRAGTSGRSPDRDRRQGQAAQAAVLHPPRPTARPSRLAGALRVLARPQRRGRATTRAPG